MNDEKLIEALWSIALSDHLGDVAEAIEPILKHFGMRVMCERQSVLWIMNL